MKFFYFLLICLSVVFLASCDSEPKGNTAKGPNEDCRNMAEEYCRQHNIKVGDLNNKYSTYATISACYSDDESVSSEDEQILYCLMRNLGSYASFRHEIHSDDERYSESISPVKFGQLEIQSIGIRRDSSTDSDKSPSLTIDLVIESLFKGKEMILSHIFVDSELNGKNSYMWHFENPTSLKSKDVKALLKQNGIVYEDKIFKDKHGNICCLAFIKL